MIFGSALVFLKINDDKPNEAKTTYIELKDGQIENA